MVSWFSTKGVDYVEDGDGGGLVFLKMVGSCGGWRRQKVCFFLKKGGVCREEGGRGAAWVAVFES